MACVGGLNGVGKACDGRACWPPSWLAEFPEAAGEFPPALPSEVSSSAGVVVGGGSLCGMKMWLVRLALTHSD